MVLTDRQREDLHAGIYEYLLSRGDGYAAAAEAFGTADPKAMGKKTNNVGKTPLLEKKWTAIPRLQKKVLELERVVAQNAKIHAHRTGGEANTANGVQRRMLPRLPFNHTLQGHSAQVICVQIHPVYTIVVSGSEDGTIKVRWLQIYQWYPMIELLGATKHHCGIFFEVILTCLNCITCMSIGMGSRKWRIHENPQGPHE